MEREAQHLGLSSAVISNPSPDTRARHNTRTIPCACTSYRSILSPTNPCLLCEVECVNNAAAFQLATREPGDPSMGVACLEASLHHTDISRQAKLSAVPRPLVPRPNAHFKFQHLVIQSDRPSTAPTELSADSAVLFRLKTAPLFPTPHIS